MLRNKANKSIDYFMFFSVNSFIVWLPFIVDAFMSSVEKGATGLTICEMIRLSKNVTVVDEVSFFCQHEFMNIELD